LDWGGLAPSTFVDIGLISSCIAAGYVAGKESGQWILGGVAGLGYVLLCIFLMALFLELKPWGIVQILAEGGLIGMLAGAIGAGPGGAKGRTKYWARTRNLPLWEDNYYSYSAREKDTHLEDWDDLLKEDKNSYSDSYSKEDWQEDWPKAKGGSDNLWEEVKWEEKKRKAQDDFKKKKAWWEEDVL